MRICIDAGHGGKDPGAIGPQRTQEKDIVIEMALLTGELAKVNGFEVIYTRTSDKYLGLSQRADIANQKKCDIFVSIHSNSFSNPNAHGIETWSYPGSIDAMRLSKLVQNEMVKRTGLYNRGSKTAKFTVLTKTYMTAILVETGFISNPSEEKLLSTKEFKNKIAKSIVKGICEYLDLPFQDIDIDDNSGGNNPISEAEGMTLKFQKFLNIIEMTDSQGEKVIENGIYGENTKTAFQKLEKIMKNP